MPPGGVDTHKKSEEAWDETEECLLRIVAFFWASLAYSQVTLPAPRTLWRNRKSSYRSGKSSGNEVAGPQRPTRTKPTCVRDVAQKDKHRNAARYLGRLSSEYRAAIFTFGPEKLRA
jgi:hypothetical protein